MTSKTVKYNQLKIKMDESKTSLYNHMPLIISGHSANPKRKIITKNFLPNSNKSNDYNLSEEKTSFRMDTTSSRSESRNKLVRFKNSNAIIGNSGSSTLNSSNYISMMNSKHLSNSVDENTYSSNNNNNSSNIISPNKPKKINLFINPTPTPNKQMIPTSKRSIAPLYKSNYQEPINIMTLLTNQNNLPLNVSALKTLFPSYDPAKTSLKSMNLIRGYGVNTYQGIIRNYNEDRVSIILNILKPNTYKGDKWPKSSFFAIYDGHGGSMCSDYLRDNLHHFIIKDSQFPLNPKEAIKKGFQSAEKDFIMNYALNPNGELADRSGSCAVVCMIVDNMIYIANVGDSRAVMSSNLGSIITNLSEDHKPNDENETKRINDAGGRVYQTQVPNANSFSLGINNYINNNNQILLGPYRIFPGRLSVSRAFGDIEAKETKFGGMSNVLISTPDIVTVKYNEDIDFIVLGCDGIFDQMTNKEVIDSIWMTTKEAKTKNIHQQCGIAVDMVMKTSLVRRSLDNVTVVVIAFSNFENILLSKENSIIIKSKESNISNDYLMTNTNSTVDEYDRTSKKQFLLKNINEFNSRAIIHQKISEDIQDSFDEKKKISLETGNKIVQSEGKFVNNNSLSKFKDNEVLRFPSSTKFKTIDNNSKTFNNLTSKNQNRKIVLKGNYVKSEEDSCQVNRQKFSGKNINLCSNENFREKISSVQESNRKLKSNSDFFKLKSKDQISKN